MNIQSLVSSQLYLSGESQKTMLLIWYVSGNKDRRN